MNAKRRKHAVLNLQIPIFVFCVIAALFFLTYATYGLYSNAIFIPGRFNGILFHGISAWFVAAAYYCLGATFSSICVMGFVTNTLRHRLMALNRWALRGCVVLIVIGFFICFCTQSGEYIRS